jgi:surface antigen
MNGAFRRRKAIPCSNRPRLKPIRKIAMTPKSLPRSLIAAVALAALPLAGLASAPAAADSRHDRDERWENRGKGHGKKYRQEAREREDRFERGPGRWVEEKHGRKVRKVYVYERPQVVYVERNVVVGPPPWAPAHGWRRKHDRHSKVVVVHEHRPRYVVNDVHLVPAGPSFGRCNRDAVGAALGGLAGAAVGSAVTHGRDRAAGIVGGGVVGALVGAALGRAMDQADQVCVGEALEHAGNGERIVWTAAGGPAYEVVPTETFQADDGRYCREYQTTVIIGGQAERAYGTACRQPDGQWEKVS